MLDFRSLHLLHRQKIISHCKHLSHLIKLFIPRLSYINPLFRYGFVTFNDAKPVEQLVQQVINNIYNVWSFSMRETKNEFVQMRKIIIFVLNCSEISSKFYPTSLAMKRFVLPEVILSFSCVSSCEKWISLIYISDTVCSDFMIKLSIHWNIWTLSQLTEDDKVEQPNIEHWSGDKTYKTSWADESDAVPLSDQPSQQLTGKKWVTSHLLTSPS